MTNEEKIEAAARRLCMAASFYNDCDAMVARSVDAPKEIKVPNGQVWAVKVPNLVPLWTFWRRDAAVALDLKHVIDEESHNWGRNLQGTNQQASSEKVKGSWLAS